METKAQKTKEYINKEFDCKACEYVGVCKYGQGADSAELYDCKAERIAEAWDEALKSILVDVSKELPEYDIDVWVINEKGYQFFCHRSNNEHVVKDEFDWCNYTGSDIVAWIRPISFDEILNANKDVLERLKGG